MSFLRFHSVLARSSYMKTPSYTYQASTPPPSMTPTCGQFVMVGGGIGFVVGTALERWTSS